MSEAAGAARVRVFFDIDCTLLLSGGAGRSALKSAMEAVFGVSGPLQGYNFHGKTDPQIVIELLSAAGLDPARIRRGLVKMWPVYLDELKRELRIRQEEGAIRLLPGVIALLSALEADEGVSLGLLTGNIEPAARLKLQAAGVNVRFEVGGYGSDSEVRREVARIAVDRSRALSEPGDGSAPIVVVGDTPEDVECARAVGARSVAVATGRHDVEELERAGADMVLKDFSDTDAALEAILAVGSDDGSSARLVGGNR